MSRLHKKFQDTVRIDANHASILINQAHGGDLRLFHLVAGAVLKQIFARNGLIVDTHDMPINNGMNHAGGPTQLTLYFRTNSNVDGGVEGTVGPYNGYSENVNLKVSGSSATTAVGDPYRTFDGIAKEVGGHMYTQAKDNARVMHHIRMIVNSGGTVANDVVDIKDVAQTYISAYVGRVLKIRNVTMNDETNGGNYLDRIDANPVEGERVTFSGPAPRWRASLLTSFLNNAGATDESRLTQFGQERIETGINVPTNISDYVTPDATDVPNSVGTGSKGGLLYKPRYKDLFTNVDRVKPVALAPGQSKFMPTKFYFTGTLENFLYKFVSQYFPIRLGYCDMLVWRQAFPGHSTHGEANSDNHNRVTIEYVSNTKMSCHAKLTGQKRLPSQTVFNQMPPVAQ